MAANEVFAPAKINLTLHVTGQRGDGYHLLDSLVVFAGIGDTVAVAPAGALSLTVEGPEAAALSGEGDNLVLRAARLMGAERGAAIRLVKRLPVASGIGGGSADAAAALRALARLWGVALPDERQVLGLGADVPACLAGHPARMRGIGDDLAPVPGLPEMDIVLVNPGVAVPTPEVFRRLERRDNPPMPAELPRWRDAGDFAGWLAEQRNDLLAPALAVAPVIGEVLTALRGTDCLFAGMSGSGATCFALYPPGSAESARARIDGAHPGWWSAAGPVLR
ncbi:4-(cytidine 5'-diphospho)-2-C-methyl-D-erythritol kinase [Seohaeicola nanhaiensis]|uniref:4-diphosphocytidyl-2-C-methyl-D-erythritol kinase n=1 Tax=Seohaeicola nanhaiensis TaxID=1387282 RepID=A0ABV9KNB2_9RHOB